MIDTLRLYISAPGSPPGPEWNVKYLRDGFRLYHRNTPHVRLCLRHRTNRSGYELVASMTVGKAVGRGHNLRRLNYPEMVEWLRQAEAEIREACPNLRLVPLTAWQWRRGDFPVDFFVENPDDYVRVVGRNYPKAMGKRRWWPSSAAWLLEEGKRPSAHGLTFMFKSRNNPRQHPFLDIAYNKAAETEKKRRGCTPEEWAEIEKRIYKRDEETSRVLRLFRFEHSVRREQAKKILGVKQPALGHMLSFLRGGGSPGADRWRKVTDEWSDLDEAGAKAALDAQVEAGSLTGRKAGYRLALWEIVHRQGAEAYVRGNGIAQKEWNRQQKRLKAAGLGVGDYEGLPRLDAP